MCCFAAHQAVPVVERTDQCPDCFIRERLDEREGPDGSLPDVYIPACESFDQTGNCRPANLSHGLRGLSADVVGLVAEGRQQKWEGIAGEWTDVAERLDGSHGHQRFLIFDGLSQGGYDAWFGGAASCKRSGGRRTNRKV